MLLRLTKCGYLLKQLAGELSRKGVVCLTMVLKLAESAEGRSRM